MFSNFFHDNTRIEFDRRKFTKFKMGRKDECIFNFVLASLESISVYDQVIIGQTKSFMATVLSGASCVTDLVPEESFIQMSHEDENTSAAVCSRRLLQALY